MVKNYLIDLAYRNICFLNFLETSLNNWISVIKDNPKEKIRIQQDLFRQKNDTNLIKYNDEEKLGGKHSIDIIVLKTEKIRDWAKKIKINISKELNVEEIHSFIDKSIFSILIEKLKTLKKEKNQILQLLFPQLIDNLFASFDLFKEIKTVLFNSLNEEKNNYSTLLLKSIQNEELLKNNNIIINKELIQTKRKYKEEKTQYENKIKLMEEEIKKYSENNTQEIIEKYNAANSMNQSLFIVNEDYYSQILGLKQENKFLKDKIDVIEKELQKLSDELKSEKQQRITTTKKIQKNIIDMMESNHKNMIERMRNAFNIEEEQ